MKLLESGYSGYPAVRLNHVKVQLGRRVFMWDGRGVYQKVGPEGGSGWQKAGCRFAKRVKAYLVNRGIKP